MTKQLSELLELERIEQRLFRGQSWDLGFRALFGGQVLGQALAAAQQTVPEEQIAHSLHAYFLLPGDASQPVIYDVENIRDGKRFATRRVRAIQHGRNIFYMTASFQFAEQGLQHQEARMPQVTPPQEVTADLAFYEANTEQMSERMREILEYHKPVDIRTVEGVHAADTQTRPGKRHVWMRAQQLVGQGLAMQQASLAYASDYHFLATSLQPHGVALNDKQLRIATIDHAIWFHKPIQFDQWLLYCIDSPFSGGSRGLVRGQFFNQQGELVASCMQEGLIRHKQANNKTGEN